jgi:hypothetical protein
MKNLKKLTLIALICIAQSMVAAKINRRPEPQMNERLAPKIAEMLNGSIPTDADLYPLFIADYANVQTQPLGQIVDQRNKDIENVRNKLNTELQNKPQALQALNRVNDFYQNTLMKAWKDYNDDLKKTNEQRKREGKPIIMWQ